MPMVHPHTLPMKLEQGDRSLRSPTRPNGALHDSATGIRVMRALARPVTGVATSGSSFPAGST